MRKNFYVNFSTYESGKACTWEENNIAEINDESASRVNY